MDMKKLIFLVLMLPVLVAKAEGGKEKIDRRALVERNSPIVTEMDTLASLTVGNGDFAVTVDVTGLQTFPEYYAGGVCLGTQSSWGWHSFPNTDNLREEEALKAYDFGRKSAAEMYACQTKEAGRAHDASEYFRINPHRLHLGAIGFSQMRREEVSEVQQRLDLWDGLIHSRFSVKGKRVEVTTSCDPKRDMLVAEIDDEACHGIDIRLPYPTGKHSDDGCDWNHEAGHHVELVRQKGSMAIFRHTLDDQSYYIKLCYLNASDPSAENLRISLHPKGRRWKLAVEFCPTLPSDSPIDFSASQTATRRHWNDFWTRGAAVDFSHCTDPRAKELERRVVLSQYLLALQSAGSLPPQETGLTMNSWFGKFHLEMILWHQAWLPLWGHEEKLARTLQWYFSAEGKAREIAQRQGLEGVRWMKMTDPSAIEAPSNVGSFLIWQQPHLIYLSEMVRRSMKNKEAQQAFVERMYPLVEETARFMESFATYDPARSRYLLKGYIPAQESLKAAETFNSPFELSQWHYTLQVAQAWREQAGAKRSTRCDSIIGHLSPLAYNADRLYLAAESATDTYENEKMTSDHPALLGALGFFPDSRLINREVMGHTLDWIVEHWNWPSSWGWDFPMTAMTATRLLQPEKAIDALLLPMQKNTYLPNGHNYQDKRLRIYLPGNGGLLSAIALMCAGWDGCTVTNPGFPKDGQWDVRWEGLHRMP